MSSGLQVCDNTWVFSGEVDQILFNEVADTPTVSMVFTEFDRDSLALKDEPTQPVPKRCPSVPALQE
jgi:hypothetical protein